MHHMAKTRTIRISEESYVKLEKMARADHRSISNMMEVVVQRYLDRVAVFEALSADKQAGGES
jgi:predicted CopG family antitoxin